MRETGRQPTRGQPDDDQPNGRSAPRNVVEAGRDLGRDLGDLRERVARETDARPFRTAALAVGAGYLLGGGLFSKLTARLVGTGLRVGLRLAFIPFVTQSLAAWGEDLLRSRPSSDHDQRPESRQARADASSSAGAGPFSAETTSASASIPRKPGRSTDPKENNP